MVFILIFSSSNVKVMSERCNKVVYLTFDDGPSSRVTPMVLDILKQKDVKATFFIIGCKIKGREDILKRITDEGHGIGLHTYSHNVKTIYSSNKAFIDEMDKTAEELKNAIGVDTKIIRFPTGSKRHINKDMAERLKEKGYVVFDWNTCASDGINYNILPDKLYKQATKFNPKFDRIVLLLHCDSTNINTVKALPSVIDFYKNKGYEFKAIDSTTKEYRFR